MASPDFDTVAARSDDLAYERLGRAATYHPAEGEPVAVRILWERPDILLGLGDAQIARASTILRVRVAEVAAPAAGDRLQVGDEWYRAQGRPLRDTSRRHWIIGAHPIEAPDDDPPEGGEP